MENLFNPIVNVQLTKEDIHLILCAIDEETSQLELALKADFSSNIKQVLSDRIQKYNEICKKLGCA